MQKKFTEQPQYSIPIGRREFIGIGFQAAIAGAAAGLLAHEMGKSSREKREREKTGVYREGETIPAFVPIEVKGWRLSMEAEHLRNYFHRSTNRTVTITFRDALEHGFTPQVICRSANNSFSIQDNFHGDIPVHTRGHRDGEETIEFRVLPSDESYAHIKCIEHDLNSAFFKEKNYFADQLSYPTQHGENFESEQERLFYSEKPLYNETTRELPETLYEKINKTIATFHKFAPLPQVYIHHAPNIFQAGYYQTSRHIEISDTYFTSPHHTDEGLEVLYHELSHGLIACTQRTEELIPDLCMLSSAHKQFTALHQQRVSHNLGHDVIFSPWDIFDESTYMRDRDATAGHPWSNYNELFASAITVLRFFPDMFIERFLALPEDEQKTVALATNSVSALLKRTTELLTANNPEETIVRLIPEYETLVSAVKKLSR